MAEKLPEPLHVQYRYTAALIIPVDAMAAKLPGHLHVYYRYTAALVFNMVYRIISATI